jgi:serine protease inhibitor
VINLPKWRTDKTFKLKNEIEEMHINSIFNEIGVFENLVARRKKIREV